MNLPKIQRRRCWQRSLKNKRGKTQANHLGQQVALRLVLDKLVGLRQRCIEGKQALLNLKIIF
jgi:hypothetical protein